MSETWAARLGSTWVFGYRAEVGLQLSGMVLTVIAILVALAIDPAPLYTTGFLIACGIFTVASVLALVVGRSDRDWLLVVPVLDMVALILLMQLPEHDLHALGYLAILPALWLGWTGRGVYAGLAVLLAFGLVDIPSALSGSADLEEALRSVLNPAVVIIAAASTFVGTQRTTESHGLLASEERETAASLAREKRTSEVLDGILDAVDIGVVAFDADGKQILANRTILKHPVMVATGLTPLELEQRGAMLQVDRLTPVDAERGLIARALRGDEYSNQIVWITAPGMPQYALTVSARPLVGPQGEFGGTVLAIDDVTVYLETIAAKNQFVGTMSHEFRTPLASIVGYLELILDDDGPIPDDVRQHLQVVERNTERLQHLVNDLLETASGERDVTSLQRESTDVGALCADVLERCRPVAATAGIQLDLEVPEPVTAVVDPRKIGQAVDNLVSNAMKLSPLGGHVGVTVTTDGDVFTIEVIDSGIGVPSDEMEALASPYFRATSSVLEHFPGVGLAIAVTKAIVEDHSGSLAVDSAVGRGTTVTLTLPVR